MGWTVTRKPANVREYLTRELLEWDYTNPETGERKVNHCIDYAQKGMTVYAIVESVTSDKEGHEMRRCKFTAVILVRYYPKSGEFGYKEMTADMGPCEHDCPRKLLEQMTWPSENESERAWRKQAWQKALKLDPRDQAKAAYQKVRRLLRYNKRAEAKAFMEEWNRSPASKATGYTMRFSSGY